MMKKRWETWRKDVVDPAHIHAMIGRKTSKSGRASVREEEAGSDHAVAKCF